MENQLDSVTEKPTCFLRLQGLACDWSKHNKHSRNIFSVHGFLPLSVTARGAAWKLAISFYRVGSPGIVEDEALENEAPNLELDGIRDTFFKSQKL